MRRFRGGVAHEGDHKGRGCEQRDIGVRFGGLGLSFNYPLNLLTE